MPNTPRAVLAALLTAVALVGPAAASAQQQDDVCLGAELRQPDATQLPAYEHSVVCLINEERAYRDLRPLKVDGPLTRAGRRQAADMVERRYFAHITPGGWNIVTRLRRAGYPMSDTRGWTVGEVLSWGVRWRSTPRATVDAWMNSPPHKA